MPDLTDLNFRQTILQLLAYNAVMKKLLLLSVLLSVMYSQANAVQFLVNSPATYLHANGEFPFFANAIDLNANGFFAGQTVLLKRVGSFNHLGGPTPIDFGLSAVFSSNNVILPPTLSNRIPGALAAGPGWVSPVTLIGGVPTDISEDFMVDNSTGTANGIILTIPAGAQYIFCTGHDNFFSDNNNTPEFYLQIAPVPEPASMIALGMGLILLKGKKRNC